MVIIKLLVSCRSIALEPDNVHTVIQEEKFLLQEDQPNFFATGIEPFKVSKLTQSQLKTSTGNNKRIHNLHRNYSATGIYNYIVETNMMAKPQTLVKDFPLCVDFIPIKVNTTSITETKREVNTDKSNLIRNISLISRFIGFICVFLAFIIPQIALFLAVFNALFGIIALLRMFLMKQTIVKKTIRLVIFGIVISLLAIVISYFMLKF